MKKIVLTGIKPTGIPHIGNFLGAIKPAIELSTKLEGDVEGYYFIADYHALNLQQTTKELKDYTYEVACTWLACGLDTNKHVFYRQSDIPQICELSIILSNMTSKGLMNRAHAYKAKVQDNLQNNLEADENVNMGLFNYPILMAADILLFNSTHVPVGKDQKQHVEITRDIASTFNSRYGKTFILPQPMIQEEREIVLGLDGRKMSKSYQNTIPLFLSEPELKKVVNKIVTDSTPPEVPKDKASTIFELYKLFATEEEVEIMAQHFDRGISWGKAKEELFRVINLVLAPIREKYNYYMANKSLVDKILQEGAKKARVVAEQNLKQIKEHLGI